MYLLRFYCTTAGPVAQSVPAAHRMAQHSKKVLLLAALALFLLAGAPGCMAQRMAWSARGTMIFLPSGF